MTADPRQTQKDIDTTTDQEWFEVLAGRRPPRHGNTSEARASRGRETLSSIYAAHKSTDDDLKVAKESVGSVAARMERRPRRTRWIEYPAVAAVAALAGFLVGQVIEGQRDLDLRGTLSRESAPQQSDRPGLESGRVPESSLPGLISGAESGDVVAKGSAGPAEDRHPEVHVARIDPNLRFEGSEYLREFLLNVGVTPSRPIALPGGAVLIVFQMPFEPSETLLDAMSDWSIYGLPGDVIALVVTRPASD